MISSLLPPWVAVDFTYQNSVGDPARLLYPGEPECIVRAVPKRRSEFTAVRHCARTALRQLGYAPVPLVPGKRGAPQWPDGVVGSMTHCEGFRAAAVARICHAASLGIDAEPNEPLPDGVLRQIARPAERDRLAELAVSHPDTHWDRLLFSAKESVFKTWYPLTGRELDFPEAELTVDPAAGTFTSRIVIDGEVPDRRLERLDGRWAAGNGLVVTAITLAAQPAYTAHRHGQAARPA